MDASKFDQKLHLLEKNVDGLINAYQKQQEENSQLKSENEALQQKLKSLEATVSDFQNQDKMAKLVNSNSVEKEDSIELKNRLNEYIKEIDKCIAYLS
jgi:regulator of replication initiation timing